jgi:TetR/AcrR family transcriptional regulator, repressor for neighboring sulfatase
MPRKLQKAPRRRRDVVVVRAEILDAAERLMVDVGPDGVRLQDVADAVGVTHSNVLHHFGNKEAIIRALVERSFEAMRAEIVQAIVETDDAGDRLGALFEGLARALSTRGHARLLFWLTLGGHAPDAGSRWLADVVDAIVALRVARGQEITAKVKADTQHAVMLSALALTANAVLWPSLPANVGMATDEAAAVRFRRWLADLLSDHVGLREEPTPGRRRAARRAS